MDILSSIVSGILSYINIPYIISINFIVYFLIKNIEVWNKEKVLDKIYKKFITFGACIVVGGLFLWQQVVTFDILLLSMLVTPYSYNYVLKNLLTTFNVEYKKEDTEIL